MGKKVFLSDEEKQEYLRKARIRFNKWKLNNPEKYKESINKYKENNKEKILERSKQWQNENKTRAKEISLKYRNKDRNKWNRLSKESRERTKEIRLAKRREKTSERKKVDPVFKISENIRSCITMSFKRGNRFKKRYKSEEILGCTIEFFINYLLTLYPEKNLKIEDFHRYGYHIDHIIPISLAKTEDDIIKLCHYTNFQPLWWKDNISKKNKLI